MGEANYNFHLNKLEVRSSLGDSPHYYVTGYATIPNTPDLYKFQKTADGYKSFKSIFTENALESIRRQAMAKKVFVDAEHEKAHNLAIRQSLQSIYNKASSTGIDISQEADVIMGRLNEKSIPFSKVNDVKIDDKGLIVETELNPSFKDIDDDHNKYFNAVWKSLENKFLNGLSINFKPTKIAKTTLPNGDSLDVIDDVDLYGISYTGQPALPENSIFEVAIRSLMETRGEKEWQMKRTTSLML